MVRIVKCRRLQWLGRILVGKTPGERPPERRKRKRRTTLRWILWN
jgi:hypothetical protein